MIEEIFTELITSRAGLTSTNWSTAETLRTSASVEGTRRDRAAKIRRFTPARRTRHLRALRRIFPELNFGAIFAATSSPGILRAGT
jgi:hypothetical protein